MLKILQARLQQYVNWELPDVQAGFRKGRGTRDLIANICFVMEKARNSRRISTSPSLTTLTPLTVWIKTNCGKFFKGRGIPDHLTCLLRNLYVGHEATVRTGHGTMDCFKIGKGIWQGSYSLWQGISLPYLINLCAEYIMWNARLDDSQARIKIPGRNINNLRYADDATLMTENKEELEASWWRWKRRVKKQA